MSNGVGGALADGDSFDSSLTLEGDLVAFSSEASNLVSGDSNGVSDVFVANVRTGVVERVSISTTGEQAHAPSFDAHISGNGRRYVAFRSTATNLVPGDTNEEFDAFVHDRLRDTTARESRSAAAVSSPTASLGT